MGTPITKNIIRLTRVNRLSRFIVWDVSEGCLSKDDLFIQDKLQI